ncbi:hypothetical protein TNCV_506881 [Trichonephila clavipes]|nr:hypothetical protein TNCV_506881 [Trichonephila clavipes]
MPSRGDRCALNMPGLKRSPVGVVWELRDDGASSVRGDYNKFHPNVDQVNGRPSEPHLEKIAKFQLRTDPAAAVVHIQRE